MPCDVGIGWKLEQLGVLFAWIPHTSSLLLQKTTTNNFTFYPLQHLLET
jgi:hypothetical protein